MRLLKAVPHISLAALILSVWIASQHELDPTPSFARPKEIEPRNTAPSAPSTAAVIWAKGRLLDDQERPLTGAVIAITGSSALLFDHTGDDGQFELRAQLGSGPPPAEIALDVLAEGFVPATFKQETPATDIVLRLTQRWEEAPTLGPIPTSSADLKLVGSAASGYGGCELVLLPTEAVEGPDDPTPTTLRRALADETGTVHFDKLVDGRYRLLLLPAWAKGGSWPNLLVPLDGVATELSFPLEGERELPVMAVSVHGTVSVPGTTSPEPVEGATVFLSAKLGGRSRHWPLVQSGPLGSIFIADVPPGTYHLKIQAGLRILEEEVLAQAGEILELGRIELPAQTSTR